VLSGLDLGWVPTSQARQVGIIILATAVPLQGIASLLAFPARDGAAGGTLGVLA
jgi:hypothetical protein